MQTIAEDTIAQKTRELCQAILDHPDLRNARQSVDKFMADDRARSQYESVVQKGQALQHKQRQSEALTGAEIAAFEKEQEALMENAVARGFLDAQDQYHHIHESINRAVSKTLELGRMPTEAELEDGGCGHGNCGCHH